VAIVLGSIGCIGLAFEGGVFQIGLFAFVFGLAYGYYSAVYAAVAMDLSDRRIAASMFAIFMMFVNLGTIGGQSLGGIITEQAGFRSMVLVMAGVNLLNIFFVLGIFNQKVSER
jgi:PAT family beta-lactamase induction signal transducer AmpG